MTLYSRAILNSKSGSMTKALKDIDLYMNRIVNLDDKSIYEEAGSNNIGPLMRHIYEGYLLRGKFNVAIKDYERAVIDFNNAVSLMPDSKKANSLLTESELLLKKNSIK